jgi:ATP-dependent helicase IRC3
MAVPVTLRDYQREAVSAVYQARLAGERSGLVVMPTGSGELLVFASVIADTRGRCLVLVYRDELIRQTLVKLHSVDPALDAWIVQTKRNDTARDVVVASVQTLSRPRRLAQLKPDFRLVISDEAHHATSRSYQRIYDHVGAGNLGGPFHPGITTTPARSDRCDLASVFDRIIFEAEMKALIAAGHLLNDRDIYRARRLARGYENLVAVA